MSINAGSNGNKAQVQAKIEEIANGAVSYQTINLSDLVIEERRGAVQRDEGTAAGQTNGQTKARSSYTVSDKLGRFEKREASSRFLTSLGRKTGISKDFFETFAPGEILDRVVAKDGDRQLVLATDGRQALGITRPEDTLVRADQTMTVIKNFDIVDVSYAGGEIKASFNMNRGGGSTDILGENFNKRFMLSIPVDGLGMPTMSPMLIRLICTNGMVGEGPLFSSEIKIGRNDAGFTLERALSTYSGDQPFAKIAERLLTSRDSYASVAEVYQLCEILRKQKVDTPIIETIWQHASPKALMQAVALSNDSPRYLRRLATDVSRYDLINMATEIRTHIVSGDVSASRTLDAFVSTLISRDPDLEGSIDKAHAKAPVALFFTKAA